MYLPSHFREDRPEVLEAFVHAHPFGMLVTVDRDRPVADHIPMLLARAGTSLRLHGHVARANPVAERVPDGAEVLAVFTGAHTYVSPGWYPSRVADGRVVPTWNYAVVHITGRIQWFNDAARLRMLVDRLTRTHEAARPRPWNVADAPTDYIDSMLRAIVGFEIAVDTMTGKFKASQNRTPADRAGVAAGLVADGTAADIIAELVREPRK